MDSLEKALDALEKAFDAGITPQCPNGCECNDHEYKVMDYDDEFVYLRVTCGVCGWVWTVGVRRSHFEEE